jgi:hypothetical protein
MPQSPDPQQFLDCRDRDSHSTCPTFLALPTSRRDEIGGTHLHWRSPPLWDRH